MLKYHRTMLSELSWICNQLGAELDYTSTHESKLQERQRALMDVSKVLYGVLADCKDNEHRDRDLEVAYECIEKLEALRVKTYPDRNGYLKPEERVNQKEDKK
jgi:hypothetical protein